MNDGMSSVAQNAASVMPQRHGWGRSSLGLTCICARSRLTAWTLMTGEITRGRIARVAVGRAGVGRAVLGPGGACPRWRRAPAGCSSLRPVTRAGACRASGRDRRDARFAGSQASREDRSPGRVVVARAVGGGAAARSVDRARARASMAIATALAQGAYRRAHPVAFADPLGPYHHGLSAGRAGSRSLVPWP